MSDLRLLPDEPERFFGLTEPFELRELKRAYGKAIRKYKPESRPEEFQRVREAYEQLERVLRYQRKQQRNQNSIEAWGTSGDESRKDSNATHSPPPESKSRPLPDSQTLNSQPTPARDQPSLRELAISDPESALKRLDARSKLDPQEHYLAAILNDATSGRTTLGYLKRLVQGLVEHPRDPGLLALVSHYLQTEVADSALIKTLQWIASRIQQPTFYMLTEPLWLRLVVAVPFDQCQAVLAKCEDKIHQIDEVSRTTFYLRFLRSAIWAAPVKWTDNVLQSLESQSAEMDNEAQTELDFLANLRELIRQETDSHLCGVALHPVRQRVLQTLRTHCQSDQASSAGQVIRLLTEIARDSTAVQSAFPAISTEDTNIWVSTVFQLVSQIHEHLIPGERAEESVVMKQTSVLLHELSPTAQAVVSGASRAEWRFKTLPMLAWFLVAMPILALPTCLILLMIDIPASGLLIGIAMVALFVGLLLSYYRWLFPRWLQSRLETKQYAWMMRDYDRLWRSRLFRYAQSSNESPQSQFQRITSVAERIMKVNVAETLYFFWQRDHGLCIFVAVRSLLR